MRILYVVHTYPPDSWGGTELHVRGLARCLAKDHDVRIFCRSGDEARDDAAVLPLGLPLLDLLALHVVGERPDLRDQRRTWRATSGR